MIKRADIYLFDERQGHGGKIVIPEPLLADLHVLLKEAQAVYPDYTYEALVRYIWVKGSDSMRVSVMSRSVASPVRPPTAKSPMRRG